MARLRLCAEQYVRASEDTELLTILDELRVDVQQWAHLWAPAGAIAAERTGAKNGWALLQEAVAAGFRQPELFEGELERLFAADPRWAGLVDQLGQRVPAPLELVEWPDPVAHHPMVLDALSDVRAEQLRTRLPQATSDAWGTAQLLLTWVRRSWEHANDHVERPDAVDVLDRVAAGERFACVEYSIVLSQSLNARGIPARRVQLLQEPFHSGLGRGHVVSEAWVDGLGSWVILDGQNGAFWVDEGDRPLDLPTLLRRHREGRPARMVCLVEQLTDEQIASWWTYFAHAMTTGYAWGSPYGPVFQNAGISQVPRLLRTPEAAYPDLDAVSVGIAGAFDRPRLTFATPHPYAAGFVVAGEALEHVTAADASCDFRLNPGRHDLTVAVQTSFGTGREHRLVYDVL